MAKPKTIKQYNMIELFSDKEPQAIDIWTTKEGTRLIWDKEGHVYPVTIGHKHWDFKWRMVYHSDKKGHWMGSEHNLPIRNPTSEELNRLTWPVPDLSPKKNNV